MAKRITDEEIYLSVKVNGDPAQKELMQLDDATRNLNKSNAELKAQRKALADAGKRDTQAYRRLTQEIKANSEQITQNKTKMSELQKQIGVTGLTTAQLRSRASQLRAVLSNLIPGSADYQRYDAELQQINARLGELRNRGTQASFSIGKLADGFNRYAALGASVIATVAGVTLSIQKFLDFNGKLADAQSDVMKTTGMTREEVDKLTKSFGAFKTRTARIELLNLATEAGRLGIEGVDNVQAFVREMDKMKVALGDDLSDEAIREVGKMVNVYKVGEATGRDFAGSMNALGSAINEVSASGANQAGFLVDYLKRQAGIAAQAKLSAADNVAYAATFDEIGQSVEVSATAMNKVWMDMFSNTATYAKIANMSVQDFSKLLNEDSNEAMIRFLEGLNGNNEGLQIMLQRLDGLEVGGARGVQAISALAGSTDLLRKRQLTSNEALAEATSLTNEFNLKNSNLQAILERVQKTIVGIFASETVVQWLESAVNWFAKFIGAVEDGDGSVNNFREKLVLFIRVVAVIIASLISYQGALRLIALWTTKASSAQALYNMVNSKGTIIMNTLKAVFLAGEIALLRLTGRTQQATIAMIRFNAVTKLNPFALLLGAVVALVGAFWLLKRRTDDIALAQKSLNDVRLNAAKAVEQEKLKINDLLKIAKDETIEKDKRLKAIKRLNEISPEYLGNLTLETIKTNQATAAINKYIASLDKKAMKEAIEAKRVELQKRLIDAKMDEEKGMYSSFISNKVTDFRKVYEAEQKFLRSLSAEEQKLWYDRGSKSVEETKKRTEAIAKGRQNLSEEESKLINRIMGMSSAEVDAYREFKEPIGEALRAMKLLNEEAEKFIQKNPDLFVEQTDVALASPVADDKKSKYDDSYLDNERRIMEELRKLRQKTQNDYFQTLEETYRKEVEYQEMKHAHLVDDLQAEYEAKAFVIQKIDQDISEAQKAGDTKKVASLKRTREMVQLMQEEINQQILHSERTHFNELGKIQAKYSEIIISNTDEHYKRERELRQMAFESEMTNETLSNKDRARRKRDFERQELEAESKYLQEKLDKLVAILQNADVDGIDFDLLSEEQKNKLQAEIAFLQNAIDSLKNPGKVGEQDLGLGNQTDILGFTQDQWSIFFENIKNGAIGIQTIGMAVQAAQNLWGEFAAFQNASDQANLRNYERNQDARKKALKKQLDNGYINQAQYRQRIELIDQELDRKKAEIEYRQAKRQRNMAIANVISNTAQAIMSIWAQVQKFDGGIQASILTGIVAATGALQLGTIMKQPLPARGFEKGYYPVQREQDGKVFNAAMGGRSRSGEVKKPTLFLAGERGEFFPEMIIDGQSYRRFSPQLKDLLHQELRGVRGFEQGYYDNQGRFTIPADNAPVSEPDPMLSMVAGLIQKNIEVLEGIQQEGVIGKFLPSDYDSIRNLKKATKRYEDLIEKNRKS